jgi:pimeloyl-ACP methyl ester carboxylesterase
LLTSSQIHGFTGSSAVWQRNIPALSLQYRIIGPDLRGHGSSNKPKHGYHVSRLAMDLHQLVLHLQSQNGRKISPLKALGGSLGCSILWCYAELFTTAPFTHMIFVDQSPLQNSTLDGWDSQYCNRGMNSAPAVAALQTTLAFSPETAHKGTVAACLAYRSHPLSADEVTKKQSEEDECFFLGEAMKGNPEWYGKLMADHTALDWRDSICATFGPGSESQTKVLVVASNRSGCFPAAGPMKVVGFVNGGEKEGKARGVVVEWGGHWCYWEKPDLFNELVLEFLNGK